VKSRKIHALVDSEGLPMRVIVENVAELANFVILASIQLALRPGLPGCCPRKVEMSPSVQS